MTNGTVFSGWFEKSRPSPSRTNFRAKIPNKQGNTKMADSLSILLALELLDDYEVEISEVLDRDDDITLFSVGSSYMRRNLNRVRDYFEGTIPFYFPDEFKGHFRIFALLTKVCRGSGAKVVQKNIQVICRIITIGTLILSRRIGSHVEFDFRALRNWARAGSRNGRMERNFPVIPIFRNFRPTSRGTPKIPE